MKVDTLQLKRSITLRYGVALGAIAVLVTLAFITLSLTIKEQEHTNYIVNISGKQRMLSQHIALDVHRFHNDIVENNMITERSLHIQKELLKNRLKEFVDANKALSTGELPNGKTITLSSKISQMYFGDMNVSARVQAYAKAARQVFDSTTHENIDRIKEQMDITSEPLLSDLNKIVFQYQHEGEKKLEKLHRLEQIVWIVTLFTLLIEVIFIFIPMTRRIVELNEVEQRTKEDLENAVELKTLHLREANKKLKFSASHDTLTGLRNRLELEKYIQKAIDSHAKNHSPYAVIMLDIDWFKNVNDTYGHDIGDDVLVGVSQIMESSVRESDKVFRAGGEEFVIILNRINLLDSKQITKKIHTLIKQERFQTSKDTFSITISSGLFHSDLYKPNNHREITKLVDLALYESKSNGRDQLTVVGENLIATLDTKQNKEK